ncbi:MAG TPA: helicase [Pseudomonadales bacterium]|nr:helicase [Pseudomonadales bacterium]
MLFRLALWFLGLRLWWLSRFNPEVQERLVDKDFIFQFQTKDGSAGRYLIVKNNRINSRGGVHAQPNVAIQFQDADYALEAFKAQAKDQMAMMKGVQEQKIAIVGDYSLLMWFMGIGKYIGPQKKKKA